MPNNTILKMDLMELQLFIKIQGFQLDNISSGPFLKWCYLALERPTALFQPLNSFSLSFWSILGWYSVD
jgi:hypothetical protein